MTTIRTSSIWIGCGGGFGAYNKDADHAGGAMTMPTGATCGFAFGLALLAVIAPARAARDQQQVPKARGNWPCSGRIDPSYFQTAEATGGEMLLLAPWEMADFAALSLAWDRHSRTVLRVGGTINPGAHEFQVPIDSSVESVLFSISVQCLQNAEVIQPSGEPAAGDGVTDYSNFVAERMVVVSKPAAGVWRVRAAGSGLAGIVVKARSALGISNVEFAPAGSDRFGWQPAAGTENVVRMSVTGRPTRVEAAIVDAAAKDIAPLTLAPGDQDGVFVARFTPGRDPFRVLIRGTDAGGAPFQRVHASLLTAR